jgi:hypothetical protein
MYILYMYIFRHIFLSNYWWQRSGIWSQASYRYPISWEAFFDPSDFYFLFVEERGYHKWALAHSSSCSVIFPMFQWWLLNTSLTIPGLYHTLRNSLLHNNYVQSNQYIKDTQGNLKIFLLLAVSLFILVKMICTVH